MSRRALYLALAAQLGLVLVALSPVAPLLGLIVVAVFVVPVLALFALTGGVAGGQDADLFVAASFLAVGALGALLALVCLYKAAVEAEQDEPGHARRWVATGLGIACAPLVMYLSYHALGVG
ncbi:MAG: hypothetical protein V2J14_02960 [Erythrobacter sp.]|jgi:hypothetical protein|nr:hypothetical protein [Erythrobacter sp.]